MVHSIEFIYRLQNTLQRFQ